MKQSSSVISKRSRRLLTDLTNHFFKIGVRRRFSFECFHSRYNYDSAAEETEDELRDDEDEEDERSGNQEQQNTREMILAEMEVLKEREKELKKRQSLHDEPYDSCEEFERENDYVADEEDEREKEQVSVMDKIREEMFELETREKELLKKRTLNPTYHRAQQQHYPTAQDEERNRAASIDSQPNQGVLTKKPIFGSRDDLVAFFGTNTGYLVGSIN